MLDQPQSGRRALLATLSGLLAGMRAGRSLAGVPPTVALPFSENPKLLVAGPADGALNRWADALLPALEQSLPPDTAIRRIEIGSTDGVTGANQFEARGAPDGHTVLLTPGYAALAWMVGDPRAQFDVGGWVPVMAGTSAAIVVGRAPVLGAQGRARVAAAGPASCDLAALLGVHLLGVPFEPLFGLIEPNAAQGAFAQGAADVVLLRGPRVPERFAALASAGAQPLFSLGALDDSGLVTRDPTFPEVPHFAELYAARMGATPSGLLYDGWRACAAAARLEFGLVLPQLTPASMVALWRRAGIDAAASLGVRATAATVDVQPLAGPAATANTAAVAASAPVLRELRTWLASRFNWRPA
jgi:hypothetical protein